MKRITPLLLALSFLTLPACSVDWRAAGLAATNAAAPIILEGIDPKQPVRVQP